MALRLDDRAALDGGAAHDHHNAVADHVTLCMERSAACTAQRRLVFISGLACAARAGSQNPSGRAEEGMQGIHHCRAQLRPTPTPGHRYRSTQHSAHHAQPAPLCPLRPPSRRLPARPAGNPHPAPQPPPSLPLSRPPTLLGAVRLLHALPVQDLDIVPDGGVLVNHALAQVAVGACSAAQRSAAQHSRMGRGSTVCGDGC